MCVGREQDSLLDRMASSRSRGGGVAGCGVWVRVVFKPTVQGDTYYLWFMESNSRALVGYGVLI
jgi:hypothetical protein